MFISTKLRTPPVLYRVASHRFSGGDCQQRVEVVLKPRGSYQTAAVAVAVAVAVVVVLPLLLFAE